MEQGKSLLTLAERCERAAGPDRELDVDIAEQVSLWTQQLTAPDFTTSLDAAMTLVPEGLEWGAGTYGNPDTEGPWAWCATQQQSAECEFGYSRGATPALALCAAALRARAAMGDAQ
jgi:hypothetical protein